MKARLAAFAVVLLTLATSAFAHRLDEYLQTTFISFGKDGVSCEMFLTPGVAVLPTVLREIDSNGDGINSADKRQAYAEKVLQDLSITVNGDHLRPQLVAVDFPNNEDLKEGLGRIHLEFKLELPRNVSSRHLRFENLHQSQISAYQVNCLMPADTAIRITSEHRNYTQSLYEVDYTDSSALPVTSVSAWWLARAVILIVVAFSVLVLLIQAKWPSSLSRIIA